MCVVSMGRACVVHGVVQYDGQCHGSGQGRHTKRGRFAPTPLPGLRPATQISTVAGLEATSCTWQP